MNILERLIKTQILQGGMGVGVSGWKLANAVGRLGQAGIVSGTGMALVVPSLLQLGDPDGSIRRALDHFPIPAMAEKIWERYYIQGGKAADAPFKSIPLNGHKPVEFAKTLLIVSNFVAIYLAKEGHNGLIGVNYLEKLQDPHLYEVYGAMLAGVDFVIVGAGLAYQFPVMIDDLYHSRVASYNIDVASGGKKLPDNTYQLPAGKYQMTFDPTTIMSAEDFQKLGVQKPLCLFIVSTPAAAKILIRQTKEHILSDGFVVEGDKAGGHNAPSRGDLGQTEDGQPIYDRKGKDNPGYEEIRDLGLPFWIAGESCSPEALQRALELGASGVQIGTAFSLCEESGITTEIKQQSVRDILDGKYEVYTSLKASPSGFPFKVVKRPGTIWELKIYQDREAEHRICDRGYLRSAYWVAEGKVGWRCSSEPVDDYLRKGGLLEKTIGSVCVCNGLMATIGLGQIRKKGWREPPLITSGDDVSFMAHLKARLGPNGLYTAKDVTEYVLGIAA